MVSALPWHLTLHFTHVNITRSYYLHCDCMWRGVRVRVRMRMRTQMQPSESNSIYNSMQICMKIPSINGFPFSLSLSHTSFCFFIAAFVIGFLLSCFEGKWSVLQFILDFIFRFEISNRIVCHKHAAVRKTLQAEIYVCIVWNSMKHKYGQCTACE